MSNIGRIDQAVLLLRSQLQRLAKERGRTAASSSATASPLQRLKQNSGSASDEEEYRRAFVRAILTEELGEDLANHIEFEAISNQVRQLLDEDEEMRALMDDAIRQLGAGSA